MALARGAARAAPRVCSQLLCFVALSASLSASGIACAPPAPPRTEVLATPLRAGPITDLVPAAGLRWLVVVRPRGLLAEDGVRAEVERLLPPARMEAFAVATGVDLRSVPTVLVARFDLGTLYVAETQGENANVEERVLARMTTPPRRSRSHPELTRFEGTRQGEPFGFVRQNGRLVAVAQGDLTYGRVLELYLLGKLRRSPPALRGAALSTLPSDLALAPLQLYASGPFPTEWQAGARGLLGAALAAGVGVWPEPGGVGVRIRVALAGSWQGEDVERLLAGWEDLARSNVGRLLSLDRPSTPPEVDLDGELLRLGITLPLAPLVSGLRAAVISDLSEMFDVSGDSGPPPG